MTSKQFTTEQTGPITLHIDTQAADVQIVADPRASGTWIELSTPDESGPAVDAIRRAEFRDNGRDVHLKLNEVTGGGNVTINRGQVFGHVNSMVQINGMTIVNGVVMNGGGYSSAGITVRAITEPGSDVQVKTMSGDVVTKNVSAVRAQTMSGDIDAIAVSRGASLTTMSGDIHVSGDGTNRPPVKASSMSGDVTGAGVDLDASSMSGRVRQQRLSAADEF